MEAGDGWQPSSRKESLPGYCKKHVDSGAGIITRHLQEKLGTFDSPAVLPYIPGPGQALFFVTPGDVPMEHDNVRGAGISAVRILSDYLIFCPGRESSTMVQRESELTLCSSTVSTLTREVGTGHNLAWETQISVSVSAPEGAGDSKRNLWSRSSANVYILGPTARIFDPA